MKITVDKNVIIKLEKHGLFSDRETISDVEKYAMSFNNGSERLIAITVYYLLYNTIAENFYLIPKSQID